MSTQLDSAVSGGERAEVRPAGPSRRAHYACWVAVALVGLALGASPFDRETVAVWLVAGLLIAAAGRPITESWAIVLSWVPFVGALLAYDLARTVADDVGRAVAVDPQLALERLLFLGAVPGEWLQQHLTLPPLLAAGGDAVYLSHFVVPVVTAAWLWTRNRRTFVVFAGSLVLMSFIAALCFVVQPTAPPWYADAHGLIDVDRTIGSGLRDIGLSTVPSVLERERGQTNPFAAIPSLHTGYALLVALTLADGRSGVARTALLAYPVAMLFVLVHGGEHYVIDGLAAVPLVVGARSLAARAVR